MINVDFTKKELKQILKYLENIENKELYNKIWRLVFNSGEK